MELDMPLHIVSNCHSLTQGPSVAQALARALWTAFVEKKMPHGKAACISVESKMTQLCRKLWMSGRCKRPAAQWVIGVGEADSHESCGSNLKKCGTAIADEPPPGKEDDATR